MRLLLGFLVIDIAMVLTGSVNMRTLVFPAESSNSYVEVVPGNPLILRAFTLCMRVATELTGKREIILFAYRTRDFDELNVWRELDGRLSFYLSGDGAIFRAPELGPLETHLCFTWHSNSGAAALFVDGKRSSTKIYKTGHAVRSGGKVILGQDPDSYLGEFDPKQSFVGEIYDVNLWDSVLSDSMIRDMSLGQRVERGNILDWQTVQLNTFGNVYLLNRIQEQETKTQQAEIIS